MCCMNPCVAATAAQSAGKCLEGAKWHAGVVTCPRALCGHSVLISPAEPCDSSLERPRMLWQCSTCLDPALHSQLSQAHHGQGCSLAACAQFAATTQDIPVTAHRSCLRSCVCLPDAAVRHPGAEACGGHPGHSALLPHSCVGPGPGLPHLSRGTPSWALLLFTTGSGKVAACCSAVAEVLAGVWAGMGWGCQIQEVSSL